MDTSIKDQDLVKKPILLLSKLRIILIFALAILGLYLTSLYNYLLYHSLVEIFSIIIGCSIFILVWNSKRHLDNGYLLLVGIAYLFVSMLDLAHTLAYKGMGIFTDYDANLPTQLWMAARYLQSLSLLAAPLFLHHKLNIRWASGSYFAITILLLVAIFAGVFPDCFVEGEGLTPFKIISEYTISFTLLFAVTLLLQNREFFDREVLRWLTIALLLTIGTELAFTFYINVYGLSNLIGHLFKIMAFYFVYKAIVEMGLERPQLLMFRTLKQSESALENALAQAQLLANTDSLTGLYNRHYFFELSKRELERAHRYQHCLSAIMLDIDEFKRINDTYGHAVGDQVLQEIAECCRQSVRKVDVLGRYGGDEFAIMLPETELSAACQVAEHLREHIAKRNLLTDAGIVKVTVSLGVSTLNSEITTPENLLSSADRLLYNAKHNGRNRVSNIDTPSFYKPPSFSAEN